MCILVDSSIIAFCYGLLANQIRQVETEKSAMANGRESEESPSFDNGRQSKLAQLKL